MSDRASWLEQCDRLAVPRPAPDAGHRGSVRLGRRPRRCARLASAAVPEVQSGRRRAVPVIDRIMLRRLDGDKLVDV
jgi:hypothetical protein